MSERTSETGLAGWIEDVVDSTTSSIEGIHKSIAALPLDVMRQTGFFEQTADDVGDLQERSISAVYSAVRDVNHRVLGLASDLLGSGGANARADEA